MKILREMKRRASCTRILSRLRVKMLPSISRLEFLIPAKNVSAELYSSTLLIDPFNRQAAGHAYRVHIATINNTVSCKSFD